MTDKPTPRTDAVAIGHGALRGQTVPADFARQLERENAELREALEEISAFDPDGTRPCEMARAALAKTEDK